ncbi:MAG: M23 family metallopeptidase [Clostridia bacterium]
MLIAHTVRFAHLSDPPGYPVGHILRRGEVVGRMGSSGQSTGPHLHIDCIKGLRRSRYTQHDIERGAPAAAIRQLNFFCDGELFGGPLWITTHYGDPAYQAAYNKVHCGLDLVPKGDGKEIHWNRSMPGRVIEILDDPHGYGHCVYVCFEIEEG